ncbi:YycH family regulatory protein [Limosilactobacillus fastidiosus]|uniref:Regulatory protein YycH domain-containing protein n=1 Tax=Limosilactobacillus fastidiosus TaxID=2759855 RepID=A0A7W3YBW4_9LACO|nr:two-component system activity regulator YycH [Limosilactobacillus fastidiosus]MBB1062489.1 hypothetical protein [Limosilactobacillus fastidiosus]MBB1085560.1 hypothetical protein [Limosilactobacillus fastidiosus]MCD7083563.1 two-component system activity regulator YycH [Limosilactobacillus fastidiosus]MCD7086013.1 two-component system activity regulator YycH [Limosilactobacillus fastidiosus]MCD7114343.1 two-component system activity regulator YycH [Limosilactobacillus fastidiosus]
MIKKIKTNWLAIALTIVVIISLFLTAAIWSNPVQYERTKDSSNSRNLNTTQSMGDLYLPTQVVHVNADQQQFLLYSSKKNLIATVQRQLRSCQLGRVSLVKSDNSDVYLGYLHQPKSLMISYSDSVTGTIFNETFSQSIDTSRVKQIDHILIPLNNPRNIYLLADHGYKIYRVRVNRAKKNSSLNSLVKGTSKVEVDHKIIHGQTMLLYPRSFTLPVFGYQVTVQNIDTLSQNLISTNKQSSISTEYKGKTTVYRDGENKRVIYNHQNGTVRYENYVGRDDVPKSSQLASYFFSRIAKMGIPMDNLRYDEISDHQRTINYRSYVEGFPIFNSAGYGDIRMSSKTNGMNKTWLSLYSIQVPLPINQKPVRLPSTTTVFNELRTNNRLKDVKGIRIGYLWKENTNNNTTVRLIPTYFVDYRGQWVDYTELQK